MPTRLSDEEKMILSYAPMIAGWIKNDTPLTEKELTTFKCNYAHLCVVLSATTYLELKAHLMPFLEHNVYGEYAKVILSPRGEKWLTNAIEMMRRV